MTADYAQSNKLALANQWLNVSDTVIYGNSTGAADFYVQTQLTCGCWGHCHCWRGWSYPVHVTSPARPIKLKLSEVEKLRAAARKDAALKKILQKFTDLIEITVDFE